MYDHSVPMASKLDFSPQLVEMDKLLAWSAETSNAIGYFTAFFRRLMDLMGEKLGTGHYENDQFVYKFGVILLDSYIKDVNAYKNGEDVAPWWKAAFDGCTKHPELSQIEYVLVQVRANAWVAMGLALVQVVGQGGDLLAVRNDFVRITDVPRALLPGLADAWAKHMPVFRIVLDLLRGPAVKVMRKTQRDGYVGAWGYARSVIDKPESERGPELTAFGARVIDLIRGLVRPDKVAVRILLKFLHMGQNRDVGRALDDYQKAGAFYDFTPMDLTDYD